jgi:small conductance mechanosensitive channel
MDELSSRLLARLQDAFSMEEMAQTAVNGLINIATALAVFMAFYVIWRLLRVALNVASARSGIDETTVSFMQTLLKYGVLAIGFISALDTAGVQTGAVIASLGIAGLTIGFAAKDALSNLISGILIFIDRPFVIGDLVEVDGQYGRVDRITLRSTRIITRDGKMLAVPNTEVINQTVASYTNFPNLRIDIAVTVGVEESLGRVRELLLGILKDKPEYMSEPAPRVVVTALNDYNLALELQAWIINEREHVELRFALRESVFETLRAAGVEMPLETLQLVAPNTEEPVPRAS